MTLFLWSQILAGISMIISIISIQLRNHTHMRSLFFISALLRGSHFFLLGVPQAAIVTMITGGRWLASIFTHTKIIKIFFIVLLIGIGLYQFHAPVALLPIISGILGTLAAFTTNDRIMRIYLIVAMILWVIHNIIVMTPVGIISSAFFLISNMIGYERMYHHNHIQLFHDQPVRCHIAPTKKSQK